MDGLLDYANIFAFWIYQLSLFWDFLSQPAGEFIVYVINQFSNILVLNFPGVAFGYIIDFVEKILLSILGSFGLLDLSLLGSIFAFMGIAFGVYFVITVVQWILKALPVV